jgi:molybdopterin biosynthesis enzyme
MMIVRKDHDQCHTVTRGEVEMWKLELDPGRPVQKGRNTVETVVIDTWLKGNDPVTRGEVEMWKLELDPGRPV